MFGHSERCVYGGFDFDGTEDGMSLELILRFNQVWRDMTKYFVCQNEHTWWYIYTLLFLCNVT